ncbi:hypothetical protein DNA98_15060 [Meiothermus sp. Pnk-1]|nr:hypothetical protein DNA98_15060 [Meiothermus sp. Pnk-1]
MIFLDYHSARTAGRARDEAMNGHRQRLASKSLLPIPSGGEGRAEANWAVTEPGFGRGICP